jgi:hypothetical protein
LDVLEKVYGTATELVDRKDIEHMAFSWGDLLNRGWTRKLVKEYLGDPDYQVNRWRSHQPIAPLFYWKKARVREIEVCLDHDFSIMIRAIFTDQYAEQTDE